MKNILKKEILINRKFFLMKRKYVLFIRTFLNSSNYEGKLETNLNVK